MAARNGLPSDLAVASIAAGESVAQFRARLVRAGATRSPELGMTRSEIQHYRLGAALEGAMRHADGRIGGFEGEIHDELCTRFGAPGKQHAVLIPPDVLRHYASLHKRADVVSTTTSGGYLVETQNVGGVGLALPRSILGPLGVQVLEGLVGNISIPVVKSAGNKTDLAAETTQAGEVDQTFGQVALTPRGEGTYTEFSQLLLTQTAPGVQALLANQILAAFAARLEFLALQGAGAAGQPLGLLNVPGVNSASGASLALSGVLGMQTSTGDRLGPSGAYIAPLATASLLAQRQKASGTSTFLWEGSAHQGVMAGYPALSTSNMPTAKLLFGNWQYSMFASWGALAVQVSPYMSAAGFQAGLVGMRILHDIDFVALDPAAFTVATSVS